MNAGYETAPSSGHAPRSEFRSNWPMILAAMVGVSFVSIPTATLGLFMAPLQETFGWSRAEISAGLTLFALISLPLMPLAGMLVDRFGARRVALPGLILSSLIFASFGLSGGTLVQWFATWVAFTLASLAIGLLVWTTAISSAFGERRGFALALVLCGAALAQGLGPIFSQWLIDSFGWRTAYVGMSAAWGGTAFLLSLFLLKDRRVKYTAPLADIAGGNANATPGEAARPSIGGMTVREALRDARMYRIAFATFLQTVAAAAVVVHLVPLLISLGLAPVSAASFAIIFAAASVVGKLLTGWLVDNINGSFLPPLCYGGPAVAFLILWQASSSILALGIALAIIGYCSGAALHLTTYLTTRYAGLRSFGTIFGLMSMVLALAGGLGPLIGGLIFDRFGDYEFLLIIGLVAGTIASLSVMRLGPYPDYTSMKESE